MTKLHELADIGQAIWLDYIDRDFLAKGRLEELREQGLRGVTSNPSIFQKAVSGGEAYDADIGRMADEGKDENVIYESLAVADIRNACDTLRPVYDETGGADGFVSLECNPFLASDTEATMSEARQLWEAVDRPNLLVKIPATPEGIPAIRACLAEGLNINITLMFNQSHYEAVANAYIEALEERAAAGKDISRIASVASFFLSRVDSAVDKILEAKNRPDLAGKAAVANAKITYARFRDLFGSKRFQALAAKGAKVQRPLWASTSTKNPAYPALLYVETLMGPDTVNTLPPATLQTLLAEGTISRSVDQGLEEARAHARALQALEIDLEEVGERLQKQGVDSFAKSFEELLRGVREKAAALAR